MISLGVIGAGHHSRAFHLPALRYFQSRHPQAIELSVLCDRNAELASNVAQEFGFSSVETDYEKMLRTHALDGCLILTPPAATLDAALLTLDVSKASILIEKPLGLGLEHTQHFIDRLGKDARRVMVSLNRRFDPALLSARAWIADRKIKYLKVTMARVNRREPNFMWTTGIHVIDAAIAMTDEPDTWNVEYSIHGQTPRAAVSFTAGGVEVCVDILPVTGALQESFEFFGEDFIVKVNTGQMRESGWQAWEGGIQVVNKLEVRNDNEYIANGTLEETSHFISAIQGHIPLAPLVADVWSASRICSDLLAAAVSD